uniref:Uncharacterized protein n=1 Tax=candidate division WOR-3 bacterium TaxID=2052148 RepID=A0A7V3ZZE3_UNCW3
MKKGISYFGVRNPHWVEKDLAIIKESGIDYIVHTYSENDMEYYEGTMHKIVKLSKDFGLEVYLDPWGVARIFGGEAFSKFLLLNDEARLVTREGKKGYGACMNNPATIEFIKKWVDSASSLEPDFIFWDEPHFSPLTNREGCFCSICKEKFKEKFGCSMEEATAEDLKSFRGFTKLEFLRIITAYAKEKGLRNVLCLLPDDEDIDWDHYASIPSIDVFGTDPYWVLHPQNFEEWMEEKIKMVSLLSNKYSKESEIWIQNFRVKKGEEHLIEKVALKAKEYRIDRISAWSYKGTAYMSYISCDDPEMVWMTLLKVYASL